MIPYKVDVPMQRWPWANFGLIAMTCAVSIYFFCTGMEDNWRFEYFLLQPDHFKWSQLAGAILIHAGWEHMVGNMIFLWVFGNAVNAKMGQAGYLGLYFGAGIFAGIVWYFLGPEATLYGMPMGRAAALGASGAIMGVVGAFLVLYPRNDVSMAFVWTRVVMFEVSAYWVIGFYVVMNVWGLWAQSEGVGYLAHVAGMAFGFGITAALVYRGFMRPTSAEENLVQLWRERDMRPVPAEHGVVAWYLIAARDPESGFKTQMKVTARTEAEARQKAVLEGLMVDGVTRVL